MSNLDNLLVQRAQIDAQIAGEKQAAIQQVLDFMVVVGVTVDDLTRRPKRRVKFRDEFGNTWAGVGQRPKWLEQRISAGATLGQFLVQR